MDVYMYLCKPYRIPGAGPLAFVALVALISSAVAEPPRAITTHTLAVTSHERSPSVWCVPPAAGHCFADTLFLFIASSNRLSP
jgi:hypothetical protein